MLARRRTGGTDYVRKWNGYVKAGICDRGDEELARSGGTRLATVTTTTLFVRTEPTTEAKVLTMLPDGDDVVTTESTEGWASVHRGRRLCGTGLRDCPQSTHSCRVKSGGEARLAREEAERQAAARVAEGAQSQREAEAARAAANRALCLQSGRKQEVKIRARAVREAVPKQRGAVPEAARKRFRKQCAKVRRRLPPMSTVAVVDYARAVSGQTYVYGGNSLTKRNRLLRICHGRVCGI